MEKKHPFLEKFVSNCNSSFIQYNAPLKKNVNVFQYIYTHFGKRLWYFEILYRFHYIRGSTTVSINFSGEDFGVVSTPT